MYFRAIYIIAVINFLMFPYAEAQSIAFPGAEGYGKFATGGRGGSVVYVTNLNDSGPGSFRDAVEARGSRTVVFSVSGTIRLLSPLEINNGNLTIAGQTAPGDGITIRDYEVDIEADNVIVRFLRFRLGDVADFAGDAFNGNEIRNVIIDHCSMSWSVDETATFYRNQDFTLQWSLIAESLNNSVHPKGHHGYGGIWGGQRASFHHNLLAHHTSRNPRLADSGYETHPVNRQLDFYNNVIYNWGYNSIYGGENGEHNIVNNYFKPGPATSRDVRNRIVNPSKPYGKYFVKGNLVEGFPEVTADNWSGGVQCDDLQAVYSEEAFSMNIKEIESADEAYQKVLSYAGASLIRDEIDERIIRETRMGTATYTGSVSKLPGIIDSQSDVGGWPELSSAEAPEDSDRDGMPDEWELKHNLDKNNSEDSAQYSLSGDYTNLEVYLNSLVEHIIIQP